MIQSARALVLLICVQAARNRSLTIIEVRYECCGSVVYNVIRRSDIFTLDLLGCHHRCDVGFRLN